MAVGKACPESRVGQVSAVTSRGTGRRPLPRRVAVPESGGGVLPVLEAKPHCQQPVPPPSLIVAEVTVSTRPQSLRRFPSAPHRKVR